MPTSKHRKDHKKKSQSRKVKVEQNKKRYEKVQRELLMNLIQKEKDKGLFNNLPEITPTSEPSVTTEGPQI